MKPEKLPTLTVLVIGFSLLIGALLTPRSYKYSVEELNLYVRALDSLRAENKQKDSTIISLRANLRVSEWNHGRILAQIDRLTEDKP